VLIAAAGPATAGPPYITDDPVPTDTGHWEIYNFVNGSGGHSAVDGEGGVDLNYGAVKDVQLTATLPLAFSHSRDDGWQGGTGNLELSAKYRFVDDEQSGVSAAIFPRVILATASHSPGERTNILLPIWPENDFAGGTSLLGGGGFQINPGKGNRNFWQGGIALTHNVNDRWSLGGEITRQGPDTVGATSESDAGVGSIIKLGGIYSLLLSGGPQWADHRTGYHFYGALGLNF
jgi:hypothetical protein